MSEWTVEVVPLLIAGNTTVINSSGLFVYNGTPAAGTLLMSVAPAAGTDPYGNTYPQGEQLGVSAAPAQVQLLPGTSSSAASEIAFPIPPVTLSNIPNIAAAPLGANTYADLIMSGPAIANPNGDWVQVLMFANDLLGDFARGELRYIDTAQAAHVLMDWGRSDQAIHIPAGGGPFINAETFHDISGGTITARVKKVPWNGVWADVEGTWAGTGTTNLGSLPDSSYYPPSARHVPVSSNAATAQNVGLFIPTSGALQVVVHGANVAGAGGCSTVYPTN